MDTQDSTCPFTWNPGEWPYATRCQFGEGHPGRHLDKRGRAWIPRSDEVGTAAAGVVQVVTDPDHRGPSLHRDKLRTLAMEWPTLAAVLAGLVEASGAEVPAPLRRARRLLAEENR